MFLAAGEVREVCSRQAWRPTSAVQAPGTAELPRLVPLASRCTVRRTAGMPGIVEVTLDGAGDAALTDALDGRGPPLIPAPDTCRRCWRLGFEGRGAVAKWNPSASSTTTVRLVSSMSGTDELARRGPTLAMRDSTVVAPPIWDAVRNVPDAA